MTALTRRARRRRLADLRRRARRRADLQPRQVRARQRPDRRAAPLPARGRDRRDDRAHGRHPRGRHRRALPRAQEHARPLAQRGLAPAGVPARHVRGVRRAAAAEEAAARAREILATHEVPPAAARTPTGTSTRSSPAGPRAAPEPVTASASAWSGAVARRAPDLPVRASDRAFVHEQAVRVLEEVGIGYNTPEAIELLAEAGAPVDRDGAHGQGCPGSSSSAASRRARRRCGSPARDPRHDVVVGDGSLTFCADGTATYMLDDVTGRAQRGLGRVAAPDHAPLRRPARGRLRLADDLGPRPRPADRRPRDRGDLAGQPHQARAGRGPRPGARGAAHRDLRGGGRRLAVGPARLLDHRLHGGAAAARARDDGGDAWRWSAPASPCSCCPCR